MKKDIHPEYHSDAKITCSCGAVFPVGSTKAELSIETCSQCHPFFTGKQKIVDSTGRVDRFKKLADKSAEAKTARKGVRSRAEKQAERAQKQADKQAAA